MKRIFLSAFLIAFAASLVGAAFNGLRPSGVDWVAASDYQILVPCPEPMGDASPISADEMKKRGKRDVLIDARDTADFNNGHAGGAISIPYDFLSSVSQESVKALVAGNYQRVIVYGAGEKPDSGELLARELSAAGIKNVYFVTGGDGQLTEAENEK